MRQIWKFSVDKLDGNKFTEEIPRGGKLVGVVIEEAPEEAGNEYKKVPVLLVDCDGSHILEKRNFYVARENQNIPDSVVLSAWFVHEGNTFFVFEP